MSTKPTNTMPIKSSDGGVAVTIKKEGLMVSRSASSTSITTDDTSTSSQTAPADGIEDKCTEGDDGVQTKEKGESNLVSYGVMYGSMSLALVVLAGAVTMPHYQQKLAELKCDSLCQGSMTSARSTLSLFGATIVGRLSDKTGLPYNARKICLVAGIIASLFGSVLTYRATSITELWISMIPTALLQQNFNVLKALFSDYHNKPTNEGDQGESNAARAGSVGMLGMAVGLAFMAGPLTGSLIKQYQNATAMGLVCLSIALGIIVGLLPVVEQASGSEKIEGSKKEQESVLRTVLRKIIPDLVPAARNPPAIFLMVARICMGLAFHVFQTIWMDVLRSRFGFKSSDYGRFFGFIGLCFALSQGFLAKRLLKRFGKTPAGRTRLMLVCASLLGGGRAVVYNTDKLSVVYCVYGAIIVALGVVNTIFTADTGAIAEPHELGGLFGVLASVESLAGIVGPILGGTLARVHPTHAPMAAVISLYGFVFFMVLFGYEKYLGNPKKQASPSSPKQKSS